MLRNAQWIWKKEVQSDEFVRFVKDVTCEGGEYTLQYCCDGNAVVYVNGKEVGFGKYPDYPFFRFREEYKITLNRGVNRIALLVWREGEPSATCYPGEAGLIFAVGKDGEILCKSDESVLCALATDYQSHDCRNITVQMGFGYRYDFSGVSDWNHTGGTLEGFAPAAVVNGLSTEMRERPILPLSLCEKTQGEIVQQGVFMQASGESVGKRMHRAWLSFREADEMGMECPYAMPANLVSPDGDGVFAIVDIGREEVGFLTFACTVEEDCLLEIGYGEHVEDGRVRSSIGTRDFSLTFQLKAGENCFADRFRRLGCRYLQLHFHTKAVKNLYAGILPVSYPVTEKPFALRDRLHQRIYDVSLRTLRACMHDHYEDTPWREQALYTMDSRNQMLFGYLAFGEYTFARASLALIAKSSRPDGLLMLTAPAGLDLPIPYFSLMYAVMVEEYCRETGDLTLIDEAMPAINGILRAFEGKMQANGLVQNFPEEGVWNFYQWAPGEDYCPSPSTDASLNAFYSLALQHVASLMRMKGEQALAEKYQSAAESVNSAMQAFWLKDEGVFGSYLNRKHLSELTNSVCILCGAATCEQAKTIAQRMSSPDNGMVGATVSHTIFKYDAFFKVDLAKYAPLVLNEIEERFGAMLYRGATTFWETDLGDRDFERAGSLSHGWSAVPVYIFHRLKKEGII
ncbi:MAG: hypothetical protein IJF71_04175 [Clostridia bacterium]|nr:hypothetical protein [Clostridia bacterium]